LGKNSRRKMGTKINVFETIKKAMNVKFIMPVNPPKNATKKHTGDDFSIWYANGNSYVAILGGEVYLVK
jgi:hypothetical protein